MSDIFFVSKVFLTGVSFGVFNGVPSMRLEHCLYGLFIRLDFFGLFNHRKTFRFRFPILALLTKMYNQKLQIRATVY